MMSEKPGPQDLQRFAIRFAIAAQHYSSRMNQLLAPHGLTEAQLSVLTHLSRLPPEQTQRIGDLARAVNVTQPAVTKMVTKFENLGLVEITDDVGDKRARRVSIKPAGRAMLGQINAALGPEIARWFEEWQARDLRRLADDLERLAHRMEMDPEAGRS